MDGWSTLARGVREQQLAAARREGVIEGLERALSLFPKPRSTTQWDPQEAIWAELKRLRAALDAAKES